MSLYALYETEMKTWLPLYRSPDLSPVFWILTEALSRIVAIWPSVPESWSRGRNNIPLEETTTSDAQDSDPLDTGDNATAYGSGEYRFFVIFGTKCIRKIVTVPLDDSSGGAQEILPVCLPSSLDDLWGKYQRHPNR